jgi:hypothetical protein
MKYGTQKSFNVFVRNWWQADSKSTFEWDEASNTGLSPDPGARKTTIARHCTETEARDIAKEYNETHPPGRLSRKAEYTEE